MTANWTEVDLVSSSSPPPAKKSKIVVANGVELTTTVSIPKNSVEDTGSSKSRKMQHEPMDTSDNIPMENANSHNDVVDTNLYSRQIYALGENAMLYLRKASILVSGIGSVGVEIAKNLILGGVRHVTIHDTKEATWNDLSGQYYLKDSDIGKNRASASLEHLAELNDSVTVKLITGDLSEESISPFDLVIITDTSFEKQIMINKWCRNKKIRFISVDCRGLFSYIFNDFGDDFVIDDVNGEHPKEFLIEHIGKDGDVTTLEGARHGLEDGDYVTFDEVNGMTQLNGIKPLKVVVKKPNVFNIGSENVSQLPDYVDGGRCKQVKVKVNIKFKTLEKSLVDPDFLYWDFAKLDAPAHQLPLWEALYNFEKVHGRSPKPRNSNDADELKKLLKNSTEIPSHIIDEFSFQATGNLAPVASVVGGIAAQEAMKAVTHHTTPLNQFLFIDHIEALPGDYSTFDNSKLSEDDCAPKGCRYDGQAAIFGWKFQEELLKQKWFIVGAGAIGCELLKNVAMMGVGCSKDGKVIVTDMDQIEISNLSRQFLFRKKDVGQKKSESAANAVLGFNNQINISALSLKVGADTESVFHDEFFSNLNGVLNALDNVEARRYMDRRCVFYRLPLLESGTLGTKGNTQVVYPYLTESYSSSSDPPEKEIPICTLKNFPYEIQHTIQWARDLFEGLFTNPAESANQFLSEKDQFIKRTAQMNTGQKIELLTTVKKALVDNRPKTIDDCVKWSRLLFQEYFHNSIVQLLHNFPPNHLTNEGIKFWSGTKRCPQPLDFDINSQEHYNFVYAGALLQAQQYDIPFNISDKEFRKILSAIVVPKYEPKSGVKIALTEAEAKMSTEHNDTDDVVSHLEDELTNLTLSGNKLLCPIDFEKDDDTNHHMEFITAASNLRAENYSIKPADRLKTKQVAGRIIPAIATTTAAVAGLVMIEMFKMVDAGGKLPQIPMSRFKNGFINLALPFFGFSEPIKAPVKKFGNKEFTLWDSLDVKGPLTLQQLIDWFEKETDLELSMLSSGVSLVYSFFMNAQKRKERTSMEVSKAVEDVSKIPTPTYTKYVVLEPMANSRETEEDVEVPYIKYEI
ncbi:GH24511p [Strongyloides ratti]|uniref:E1 ubiquitin-activating enzyme n=1 Tax=Strongyloides ratti TaxID=34506 RepID=A0A090KZH4_STRRB|nr:GH24511p [Strongyloides ratti]CEF61242.1 GH24511p [Strongyloides ratti]